MENKRKKCCRWLVTGLVILLLAACGKKPPPLPPQVQTLVNIDIEVAADINQDRNGRPSPLALRVYQLKTGSQFNSSDFISLYEKDASILGADLVQKDEMVLQADEKYTLRPVLGADVSAIGVMALFREYEQANWRASIAITPHTSNQINIYISGTSLTVR